MGNEAVGPLPLDVDAWDAWSPAEAQRHLDAVDTAWYVAAGWALDLFLGRPTRAHQDLEIGVPADRFGEVRAALDDLEFVVIGEGQAWPIAESTLAAHRQTWGRERSGGPWRIDVFREPWKGDEWTYDSNRRIRMPAEDLISYTVEGPVRAARSRAAAEGEDAAREGRDGLRDGAPALERRPAPVAP